MTNRTFSKAELVLQMVQGIQNEELKTRHKVALGVGGALGAGIIAHHLRTHGHHDAAASVEQSTDSTPVESAKQHAQAGTGHPIRNTVAAIGVAGLAKVANDIRTRGFHQTVADYTAAGKKAYDTVKHAVHPATSPIS